MRPAEPAARGQVCRTTLDFYLTRPGGVGHRLREALSERTVHRLSHATALEWVPIREVLPLHVAPTRVLGADAHRALLRESMQLQVKHPLLRGFLGTSVRSFGVDPVYYLRAAAQLWPLLFRGTAVLDVTPRGARGLLLVMSEVCEELASVREFTTTYEGILLGTMDQLGLSGRLRSMVCQQGREQLFFLEW